MNRFASLTFIAIVTAGYVCPARAQSTRPVTQPTAPSLEVHEWAVFVLDASDDKLNEDGTVQSTLPSFVTTRRREAKSKDRPYPIGVIRFTGTADSKVDVKIEKVAGTFLSSWPKAITRSNQLLWQDLTVASSMGIHPLESAGSANWFDRLRQSDSDYLNTGPDKTDRFLLYDIEMPYKCALRAKTLNDGAVELNNAGTVPLHDVTLYRTDHGRLMQAAVGEMDGIKSQTPLASVFVPSTQDSKAVAAKAPTTVPAAKLTAHLVAAPSTQPAELASNWKHVLSGYGIAPADVDLATDVMSQYAFNAHSLTAVYRLDDAEFDRLLPLEVVPEPQKIVRVALVIVPNLDPDAPNEIDDLIAQLGDPVWSKRQAAYDALKSQGTAASSRLQAATKNKDVEIAWRAERLLAAGGVH